MQRMSTNKNRMFLSMFFAALVAVGGVYPWAGSYASRSDSAEVFLASLFPATTIKTVTHTLGSEITTNVLTNIKLRGKKGFIPFNEVKSIKLSSTLAVVAFPIYLHNSNNPQHDLIQQSPSSEQSRSKLVQVLFYNPKTQRLFGKPEGFPLTSRGWSCRGDFCDNVASISLESIENSSNAVVFKYSYGLSSHKLTVFALDNTNILSSSTYNYGDLGGESGIEASVEYTNFAQVDGTITATVHSVCDDDEMAFCSSLSLMSGSTSKVIQIPIRED